MISLRTWLKCVCVFTFLCGVVVPLVLFVATNGYEDLDGNASPFIATVRGFESQLRSHERKPLDYDADPPQAGQEDMQYQAQELQRIVVSVRNELRRLEEDRNQVRKELDTSKSTLSKVRREVVVAKLSLQDSKTKLAKAMREMKRANQYEGQPQATKSPVVVVNLPAMTTREQLQQEPPGQLSRRTSPRDTHTCFEEHCFDYSRCPLTEPFSVYVYNQHHPNLFDLQEPGVVRAMLSSLQRQHALITDPTKACVLVVLIGPLRADMDEESLQGKLSSLSHWDGGRNHLVIDLAYQNSSRLDPAPHASLGHAIFARSYSSTSEAGTSDILLPPITDHQESTRQTLPPFLPALRQTLILFEGTLSAGRTDSATDSTLPPLGRGGVGISNRLLTSLQQTLTANTRDKVAITANCSTAGVKEVSGNRLGEWLLCGSARNRGRGLSQATFSLVVGSRSGSVGPITYARLLEGLRYGAVPVILGVKHLPFGSVLDWSKAAVILPPTSLGQLHYILRNIDRDTILQYRRQGRFLWETYFSSHQAVISTVLALLRQRTLHPPPPAAEYVPPTTLASIQGDNRVLHSPEFLYNFTSYTESFWNSPPGPFHMYPTTPFKPAPISGTRYAGMDPAQVPNLPQHVIAAGGITGPFFEDYLLGDVPEEQFTVVMLTYERNEVMLEALGRLRDLDHLAKVVVVWNSPKPPPPDMKWPDIGAAIDVSDARVIIEGAS